MEVAKVLVVLFFSIVLGECDAFYKYNGEKTSSVAISNCGFLKVNGLIGQYFPRQQQTQSLNIWKAGLPTNLTSLEFSGCSQTLQVYFNDYTQQEQQLTVKFTNHEHIIFYLLNSSVFPHQIILDNIRDFTVQLDNGAKKNFFNTLDENINNIVIKNSKITNLKLTATNVSLIENTIILSSEVYPYNIANAVMNISASILSVQNNTFHYRYRQPPLIVSINFYNHNKESLQLQLVNNTFKYFMTNYIKIKTNDLELIDSSIDEVKIHAITTNQTAIRRSTISNSIINITSNQIQITNNNFSSLFKDNIILKSNKIDFSFNNIKVATTSSLNIESPVVVIRSNHFQHLYEGAFYQVIPGRWNESVTWSEITSYLDLTDNQFSILAPNAFMINRELYVYKFHHFYVSNNAFLCSCDNIQFFYVLGKPDTCQEQVRFHNEVLDSINNNTCVSNDCSVKTIAQNYEKLCLEKENRRIENFCKELDLPVVQESLTNDSYYLEAILNESKKIFLIMNVSLNEFVLSHKKFEEVSQNFSHSPQVNTLTWANSSQAGSPRWYIVLTTVSFITLIVFVIFKIICYSKKMILKSKTQQIENLKLI